MSTPERQWARYLLIPVIVTSATLAAMRSSLKAPAEYDRKGAVIAAAFAIGALITYVALAPPAKRKVALIEGLMLSLMFFCAGAIMYPVMQSARSASGMSRCISNVKQMLVAEGLYAEEFGDRYPRKQAGGMHSNLPPTDGAIAYAAQTTPASGLMPSMSLCQAAELR